jgi:hypothetical protein
MFSTFIKLTTLENLARAIHWVNKTRGARLRLPGILILVTVFGSENRGEGLSQHKLIVRLGRFHNMTSCKAVVSTLNRLVDRGFLQKTRQGRALMISCTMAGRSYCIDLERALRNVRFNK